MKCGSEKRCEGDCPATCKAGKADTMISAVDAFPGCWELAADGFSDDEWREMFGHSKKGE